MLRSLKISRSTATRLMTRARDAGLAPEVRIQERRRAPVVFAAIFIERTGGGTSIGGGTSW